MKKIFYTALSIMLVFGACNKDFEEINQPWKNATTADMNSVYNGIVKSLILTWNEQSVANSIIYPITQQGTITATSGYRTEAGANDIWNNYYKTLVNVRIIEKMFDEYAGDKASLTNVQAMVKTLVAYKTLKVCDLFGDIPFFEAGKVAEGSDYYRTKYDSQKSIYEAMISDLKWATDNLSSNANQVSLGASETFLNGDIIKWKKFANSLRLRYAIRIYAVDKAFAQTHIKEALTQPLLADGEDMGIWPGRVNEFLGGREWSFYEGAKLRMGSTMWNLLSNNNNTDGSGIFDQRAKIFFETNLANEWAARDQNPTATTANESGDPYNRKRDSDWNKKGTGNIYSNFNYYWGRDNTIPELIITAAEVHFSKAEAAARGMDGTGVNMTTAKTEYEAGIKASVNFWTKMAMNATVWVVNKPTALPTALELSWITTNPKVLFPSVGATEAVALKLIYTQQWIDNFRQPYEAWALLRRTQNTPMETVNASYYTTNYGAYKRFDYPDTEKSRNAENLRSVTGGVSGQEWQNTKVWWAK